MTYTVTIKSKDGDRRTFTCGGANDQEALIYAGKVVEGQARTSDGSAWVVIMKDGKEIGPASTVGDMLKR